jgi:predicted dehydrogenase
VIGCGAITEIIHLPVVAQSPDFRLAGLIDVICEPARTLAAEHGAEWTASDYREAIGRADAALLAVPHHLHAPMAIDLLRAGMHVLVEKPMALSVRECDRMIDAAADSGSVLGVGLVRRFFESNRLVAALVRDGRLGAPRRVRIAETDLYRWPMRSGFAFDPAQAGGGTLANLGVHTLDLLCWWFGSAERVDYRDDARGGVEAEFQAAIDFPLGVHAEVLISKLRDVTDTCRVEFEDGALLIENAGSEPSPRVRLIASGRERTPPGADGRPPKKVTRREMFGLQLADFARAIREGGEPLVCGREGRRSVELLERCYGARRSLVHPWEDAEHASAVGVAET